MYDENELVEDVFDKEWEICQTVSNSCCSCYYVTRHHSHLSCQARLTASWIPGIKETCWLDREIEIFSSKSW